MRRAALDTSALSRKHGTRTTPAAYKTDIFLTFVDRDLEEEFRQDIAQSQRRYVRLAAVVMMSIYIVFGVIEDLPWDGGQPNDLLLILRYLVVVPACAAFIGFTYTPSYQRYAQLSAFVTVLIVGSIWLKFLADDDFDQTVYFLPPLIEVNICALFFLGLLLRFSLLLCAIFGVIYGYALSGLDYDGEILSGVIVSVVVINGLLILCAYQREMVTRTLFVKNREEQHNVKKHAQDDARDLEWLRGLAAFLRHEVRQPVALINSSLGVMQMTERDAGAKAQIANAETGVRQVWSLIDRATRATDAETFVRQSQAEIMDLSALTSDVVESFRQTFNGVDFEGSVDGSPTLFADPALIREAIANLLSNASSFAEEGSTINVALHETAGEVVISVVNRGPTIAGDPDVLFGPFRSTRLEAGSDHQGLGLYLVRLIAEHYGGQADLANLPDHSGVEASIRLPLA